MKVQEDKLIREKVGLEKTLTLLDEIKGSLKKANSEYDDARRECEEFIGKELMPEDDPIALLGNEIEALNERLDEIEQAVKSRRKRLGDIAYSIKGMRTAHEAIEIEEKIREIGKISKSKEYKELEKLRDNIAAYVNDVETLSDVVAETMRQEAREKINIAGDEIDSNFRKITANPAVERLEIQIREGRSGSNDYRFCDQDGNELNPVLSLGDLNSMALSIFLGLVRAYPHPVGFVMMDDPSQSLGTDQKKRLVEVLDEVSFEYRSM